MTVADNSSGGAPQPRRGRPKFWVIRKRMYNSIGHRALTSFEVRNPHLFEISRAAFDTWPEAHAELLRLRTEDAAKAKRDLRNAERSLARVKAMQMPKGAALPGGAA